MVDVINIVFNAIIISSIYALIAIGFTLIFGVGGSLNLAHGALITVGAYTAFHFTVNQGNLWAGLLIGTIVCGIAAGTMYLGLIRFVDDEPLIVMILTILLAFMIEHLIRISFIDRIFLPMLIEGNVIIINQNLQLHKILILLFSILVITLVFIIINKTKKGQAMLALSMNPKGAALVGINARDIQLYTWVLSGALAGFSGILLTTIRSGTWNMGIDPLILSFSIVILGGLGSIRGSIVAAFMIGFIETGTVTLIDPRLSGVPSLVVIIVTLLVYPEGLFGHESVGELL